MNITKKIAIAAAAGAITLGGGAAAMASTHSAASTSDTPTSGPKVAFVCSHLDQIEAQQKGHLDLLNGRLTLLKDAQTAYQGKTKAEARIQKRIDTTNAQITKVEARQAKLTTWAASHCNTTTGSTPTMTDSAVGVCRPWVK